MGINGGVSHRLCKVSATTPHSQQKRFSTSWGFLYFLIFEEQNQCLLANWGKVCYHTRTSEKCKMVKRYDGESKRRTPCKRECPHRLKGAPWQQRPSSLPSGFCERPLKSLLVENGPAPLPAQERCRKKFFLLRQNPGGTAEFAKKEIARLRPS